ncbi:hypothetical protein RFI_18572, partial [Reticulomyxa filosa]
TFSVCCALSFEVTMIKKKIWEFCGVVIERPRRLIGPQRFFNFRDRKSVTLIYWRFQKKKKKKKGGGEQMEEMSHEDVVTTNKKEATEQGSLSQKDMFIPIIENGVLSEHSLNLQMTLESEMDLNDHSCSSHGHAPGTIHADEVITTRKALEYYEIDLEIGFLDSQRKQEVDEKRQEEWISIGGFRTVSFLKHPQGQVRHHSKICDHNHSGSKKTRNPNHLHLRYPTSEIHSFLTLEQLQLWEHSLQTSNERASLEISCRVRVKYKVAHRIGPLSDKIDELLSPYSSPFVLTTTTTFLVDDDSNAKSHDTTFRSVNVMSLRNNGAIQVDNLLTGKRDILSELCYPNEWIFFPSLVTCRDAHNHNSDVAIICDGYNTNERTLSCAFALHLNEKKWHVLPSFSHTRSRAQLVHLQTTQGLLIAGGYRFDSLQNCGVYLDTVEYLQLSKSKTESYICTTTTELYIYILYIFYVYDTYTYT